jgi:Domain of unknown function (DUF4331)
MSNHFSAANLKFPGDDARLDLTDLFVFPAPGDPGRTELIMDANPFMTGSEFHPDAVYRINIDNDGDLHADAAFSFVFSQPADGMQTGTVYYATGGQAREAEPSGDVLIENTPVGFDASSRPVQAGPVRLFIGERSDPFFADIEGALHGYQWTGVDAFADKNVLSVALEVPNDMLGPGPEIGVWMTVSLRHDGTLEQMDRGGNPTMNPIVNPDDVKDQYNKGEPATDAADYLPLWTNILRKAGGYSTDEATAVASTVLPDILHYDRTRTASYPNGRILTDDVFSTRMAFLTNGKAGATGLKPHGDMQADFPFLGVPNP